MKAHIVKKTHPCFTQKTFTVCEINHLKNYEVAFKFFPEKIFVYGPAPKAISFQNKLAIENKNNILCLRQAQAPNSNRWLSL